MPLPTALRPAATLLLAVLACPHVVRAQDDAVRGTFLRACATCHGEDGSGTGPTVLDRPARDFKAGGFSFGNTPDALLRTITYGIPGTPMPAFAEAFTEDERTALAEYVRTLGPPVEELDVSDRVMTVADRPRLARGILPPVAHGAPLHPRGLLVGTPEGLSFEYRIDDLRLLAVRQGGFVERTDWVGRGGTPLLPLGVPLVVFGEGAPGAGFEHIPPDAIDGSHAYALSDALAARLRATRESADGVALVQALSWAGSHVADVVESPVAVAGPTGIAWERRYDVTGTAAPVSLVLPLEPAGDELPAADDAASRQVVSALADGRVACLQVAVAPKGASAGASGEPVVWRIERGHLGARLRVDLVPSRPTRITVRTIMLPEWTDESRAALAAWEPLR